MAIASRILERFPPDISRIIEIGAGWGSLSILLARIGYEVFSYEGNASRYAGCRWHFDSQIERFPELQHRLQLAPMGLFPQTFDDSAVSGTKINVCLATNLTHSYTRDHASDVIWAASVFDELILDIGRFGKPRETQRERDEFLRTVVGGRP